MTTIKPRTTTVILFQGDDHDPIEALRAASEQSVTLAGPARLGDANVRDSMKAYDEFIEGAIQRAVHVELKHVGRKRWRQLLEDHPPRDGVEEDKINGFNTLTMGDELVPESVQDATSPTPENTPSIGSPALLGKFLDDLSDGDFSLLFSAAVDLNQKAGPDPKARLCSRLDQILSETSASPERLG